MAPEVFSNQGYDMKVDIYSFGLCFFEMAIAETGLKQSTELEPVGTYIRINPLLRRCGCHRSRGA